MRERNQNTYSGKFNWKSKIIGKILRKENAVYQETVSQGSIYSSEIMEVL